MTLGVDQFSPMNLMTLANTMSGLDTQSQADAMEQQLNEALAQHTKQATQAAADASGQYQQAAGAPPPTVDPMSNFIQTLLNNTASTLSQNPTYAANNNQRIRDQHADLIKARAENLAALKDASDQKAKAAQAAGDLESESKFRLQSEKISKTYQQLLEQQRESAQLKLQSQNAADDAKNQQALEGLKHGNRLSEIAARAAGAATTAKAKEQAKKDQAATYLDSLAGSTTLGNKYLDLTNVPSADRGLALQFAKEHGLVALDKGTVGRVQALDEVRANFDDMLTQIGEVNPKTGKVIKQGILPADWQTRNDPFAEHSAARNLMEEKFQTNDQIASFGNWSIQAIRNIQALAAGMGSGFRLNQAEIETMMKNIPKITDTIGTARAKVAREKRFMENLERVHFRRLKMNPNGGFDAPQPITQPDQPEVASSAGDAFVED